MGRSLLLAGALVSVACSAVPSFDATPATSSLRPGLSLRGGDYATLEDHLVEMVVHEDHVYVANSNLGVSAMHLDDNGGVTLTEMGQGYEAEHRCTNLALHASSHTLYCGSDAPSGGPGIRIELFDVSMPGHPVFRESFLVEEWGTRDLEVVGSRLMIQHFDGGLWTADIAHDGGLSGLQKSGVTSNARSLVAVGDRLVLLGGDVEGFGAELRLLDSELEQLDRIALRGPPLGLSADAEGLAQVAVGLGSAGVAVVAIEDDRLRVTRTLEAPGVATMGLIADDLAIAVTLSGAFAWELDGPSARMFGFGPSGRLGRERAGNMLHGLLHEGELLTSDWLWVERWAIDRGGEVLDLDVPRGIYVQPEGGVRWRMRNPGRQALRVELWTDRAAFWTAEVGPGELVEVALSAAERAAILATDEPRVPISVRAFDPEVPSEGDPSSSTLLMLAQRPRDDLIPPAIGDPFPTLMLEDVAHEVYAMPTSRGSQTIWFWPDCALMWPELEDLAWLEREGIDLGRGDPILLTPFDISVDGFVERWGLEGMTAGMWGVAAPTAGHANDWLDENDIYMPFFIFDLPGDAMPTDFVVDGEGIVRSIERMYRGVHTLVVPGPWE